MGEVPHVVPSRACGPRQSGLFAKKHTSKYIMLANFHGKLTARYTVTPESYGMQRYLVRYVTVFWKYYGTKRYMVNMVRFSENRTVLQMVRYMVAETTVYHGYRIPRSNRGQQPRYFYRVEPWK